VYCPTTTDENATWSQTAPGETTNGECLSGYYGNPERYCNQTLGSPTAEWATIENPCQGFIYFSF